MILRPFACFNKPSFLQRFFFQSCFFCTALIVLAFFNSRLRIPKEPPPDHCLLVGANPRARDLWQFNTRSLCISSHVCLSDGTLYRTHTQPICTVTRPDLSPTNRTLPALVESRYRNCTQFQHSSVYCAHGKGLKYDHPVCPNILPLTPATRGGPWIEHVSIVVPEFPWQRNIFHYVKVVTDLANTFQNLPVLFRKRQRSLRNVNIYFQAGRYLLKQGWQRELLQISVKNMEKNGIIVSLYFMEDIDRVCLRNAVLLGRRGHVNSWPFMNATEVPLDGKSVPKGAVDFKRAVYDTFDIKGRLPNGEMDGESQLPPFAVGYSRRDMEPDSEGYYRTGANRRFSAEDDAWLEHMLKNETESAGAKLFSFAFSSAQCLREQVDIVAKVGFIVGIHGANLVNAVFMPPFGVMMEIFPKGATERCYVAGGNSGLKYLRFEPSEMATPWESGCDPKDVECRNELRQRRVKLDKKEDRTRIREMVREGIKHLREMRDKFPRGIPVQFNRHTVNYDVREA